MHADAGGDDGFERTGNVIALGRVIAEARVREGEIEVEREPFGGLVEVRK